MNTFDGLDVLDAELARRLAECEEHLRAVVSDYRALVQTALFGALEPDLRSQIATAVRGYVARGTERLQTAKAAINAIRSLDSACALPADPLAGIAPPDSAPAPAPLQPAAAVSRLREPQSQNRRAPEAPPADDEAEFEDVLPPDEELGEDAEDERAAKQMAATTRMIPNDQKPEVLPPELRVAPAAGGASWAGAGRGRPKPGPTRGSAAPVRGDGFRRSAPEQVTAAERTGRVAVRRHRGGADIRPVSQEEMLTGVRPGEADPGDGGGVVSPSRPTSPDAIFDATHKRLKEQQRRNIAAKGEAETARLANVVLREAALIDNLGNTVGRASTVLKDGNLLTAEQIEVFLDSLEGPDQSAEEPEAALQAIMKAKSAFQFEGPDEGMPAIRAMISYAKECAFADDDPGVLVLQGVGLARR